MRVTINIPDGATKVTLIYSKRGEPQHTVREIDVARFHETAEWKNGRIEELNIDFYRALLRGGFEFIRDLYLRDDVLDTKRLMGTSGIGKTKIEKLKQALDDYKARLDNAQ